MASHPTPVHPHRRRASIAAVAAAALALTGLALAVGAATAGAAPAGGATESATATTSTGETMAGVWAELDPATQATLCTGYLLDADGTWQQLAPVLVAAGISHDQAAGQLDAACSAQRSVRDLRD